MKWLWRILCRMSHNGHFRRIGLHGYVWCCHQDNRCDSWGFGCDGVQP